MTTAVPGSAVAKTFEPRWSPAADSSSSTRLPSGCRKTLRHRVLTRARRNPPHQGPADCSRQETESRTCSPPNSNVKLAERYAVRAAKPAAAGRRAWRCGPAARSSDPNLRAGSLTNRSQFTDGQAVGVWCLRTRNVQQVRRCRGVFRLPVNATVAEQGILLRTISYFTSARSFEDA